MMLQVAYFPCCLAFQLFCDCKQTREEYFSDHCPGFICLFLGSATEELRSGTYLVPVSVPPGYTYDNATGFYYAYLGAQENYATARAACSSDGARVAMDTDLPTQNAIRASASSFNASFLWLGCSDEGHEGNWTCHLNLGQS